MPGKQETYNSRAPLCSVRSSLSAGCASDWWHVISVSPALRLLVLWTGAPHMVPISCTGRRVRNRCIHGCKWSQKYVFLSIFGLLYNYKFFSHFANLSLFFFFFNYYLKGDLRGISSLSLSHCASVPCRRGEVVSAVWARERQIITLWETGDTAIVLSVCVPVCMCLCESRRILSNLLLVLKWYYLSLFPYQKWVFSRSLSVWDDVFKAV